MRDKVLLKLHRTYSHDEAIMYVIDKLTQTEIENALLKSQIHELEEKLTTLTNTKTQEDLKQKGWAKEFKYDAYVSDLRETIKRKTNKNKALEKSVIYWRNKFFNKQHVSDEKGN